MKKSKKLLSIILSLTMILSTVLVALAAFAASPDDIVEKINAFNGRTDSKATEEDIKEFEAIASEYKALTEAKKDELDIIATGKLVKLAVERGKVLNSSLGANDKIKAADTYVDEVLGKTQGMKKAQEFFGELWAHSVKVNDKDVKICTAKASDILADSQAFKAAFDEEIQNYKDLGAASRYVPMLYYSAGTGSVFYNDYSRPTGGIKEFWEYFKTVKEAENPFTEVAPNGGDRDKYPGGYSDPQYKADKLAYDDRKAQAESQWCKYAWEKILEIGIDSDLVDPVSSVGMELVNLIDKYTENQDSVTDEDWIKAYEKVENLSDPCKLFLSNTTSLKYDYVEYGDIGPNRLLSFASAADIVKGMCGLPIMNVFITAVNEAEKPYTREAIEKACDAWAEVFEESYSQVPTEVMDKFKDMIASMPASEEKPILPDWTRPDLKYPAQAGENRTALLIETLDKMIVDLVKGQGYENLSDLLAKEVYTNYTVASIAKSVYPAINDLLAENGAGAAASFIKLTPRQVAGTITEPELAEFSKLLKSLSPDGKSDAVEHWANLDPAKVADGTFGFKDGDKDGFVKGLAVALRGITTSLNNPMIGIKFGNEVAMSGRYPTADAKYVYGLYEQLIPVFEALDFGSVITSDEFTQNYNEAKDGAKGDAIIVPILNPIFDFVNNKLAAAPVSALVDILPKLAHLLNDGILNEQLQLIHGTLGMLSNLISADLLKIDPSAIIGLVNGLIGNLQIGDVTLNLKLSDPDWALLASTAKPVVKESVSGDNAYRVGFETNKSDAILVVFRYLFENITEENNLASIKKAVSSLVTDSSITQVIDQVLGSIAGLSADQALVMICDLLGVPQVEEPTEPTDPTTPTEPGTDGGNVTPPANGDSMMIGAIAALVLVAGAALVMTKKRK